MHEALNVVVDWAEGNLEWATSHSLWWWYGLGKTWVGRPPSLITLGVRRRGLNAVERVAIWMAHSRRCAYCGEPVQFRELEIDHIIPESLESRPLELERLKAELGLPPEFNLNSVLNLLPSHAMCNSRKTDRLFSLSSIRFFLEIAEGKMGAIGRLVPSLELEDSRERLLVAVQSALDSGNLEFGDLIEAANNAAPFLLTRPIEFESGMWHGTADAVQIERLLDTPVGSAGGCLADGVHFVNDDGSSLVIRTCRQYRAVLAAGYQPASNTDWKISSSLMVASAVLEAVSRARLAAVSYIRFPRVGVADLHLLSASVLPATSDDDLHEIATLGAASLQGLLHSERIRVVAVSSNHLDIAFRSLGMELRELLRADLDGDGVEEVLVRHLTYAIGGTHRGYSIGLLRRSSPDVRFEYKSWQ